MPRHVEEFICLLAFQFKFKIIGYFKTPKLYNPDNDNGSLWIYLQSTRHTEDGSFDSSFRVMAVVQSKVCYCICACEIRNCISFLKHFVQSVVLAFSGTVS